MRLLILLIPLSLLATTLAGRERVYGGSEAKKGEFPFMVHIQPKDGAYLRAAGTILNEWWIMTTDSAADMFAPFRYKIVAGEHNLDVEEGTEQERVIAQIVPVHSGGGKLQQGSRRDYKKDILLIKVNIPFEFNEWVQPVTLSTDDSIHYNGTTTIVGWGDTGYNGPYAKVLQKASIPIVPKDPCQDRYSNNDWHCDVTDAMICAGAVSSETSNCFGDYGAPILVKSDSSYVQIGLFSWGKGCEDSWYPGVYTKVASYSSYIESTLSGYLPPCDGFQCADKSLCLPKYYECDQITECVDGSDEHVGCDCNGFRCASGNGCIWDTDECDGDEHCPDGSDEHANCKYWYCDDGKPINENDWCDGMTHCSDNSDEQNCPCFECKDGSKCILPGWECDGFMDCDDGSDEHWQCDLKKMIPKFQCKMGSRIPLKKACNGVNDCGDWSDEAGCASSYRSKNITFLGGGGGGGC